MNSYVYCGGNSVNYFDPTGNFPISVGDVGTFVNGQAEGWAFNKALSVLPPGMQTFTNLALGEQSLIAGALGAMEFGVAGLTGQITAAAANASIESSIQIFLGGDLTVTLAINDIGDAFDGQASPGGRKIP